MPNPIFNLIALKKVEFELHFQIERKTAKTTGKDYFYIVPKVAAEQPIKCSNIMIDNNIMQVIDFHISVYENLNPEHGKGDASHHVTLNLADEKKLLKMTAHVHFNVNNKMIFVTLRDINDSLIPIDKTADIAQAAQGIAGVYFNHFWDIYTQLTSECSKKHDEYVEQLTTISKKIIEGGKADEQHLIWKEYSEQLDRVLTHLKSWYSINLQSDNSLLRYFEKLRKYVATKLSLFAVSPTIVPGHIDENETIHLPVITLVAEQHKLSKTPKQESFKSQLSETEKAMQKLKELAQNQSLQPHQKLIREYQLLNILQQTQEEDQFLNTVIKLRALEEEAHRALIRLILQDKEYKKLVIADQSELIKMIPLMTPQDLLMAVKNNRKDAVDLIIKLHPYINLNALVGDVKITLLEQAYQLNNLEIFIMLLNAGAFCDTQNAHGQTLLSRACQDMREKEMVALLNAGASSLIRDANSFTAFGTLTMMKKKIASPRLIELYLKNCSNIYIDLLQGPMKMGCTPLHFACQENWVEQAEVLIRFGANPHIVRESDFLSSLAICAAKGHAKLLGRVLELSKRPLTAKELGSPYILANDKNQKSCVDVLERYAVKHGITLSKNDWFLEVAPGTSQELFYNFLQGKKMTHPMSNPYTFFPVARRSESVMEIFGKNFKEQAAEIIQLNNSANVGKEEKILNPPNSSNLVIPEKLDDDKKEKTEKLPRTDTSGDSDKPALRKRK